jgi:hypothetical protein
MSESNVELYSITPFKEDDCWYLKLIYKYEDKNGKHTVVIPKTSIPFSQRYLPVIRSLPSYNEYLLEPPYIVCRDSMMLYKSTCDLASERGVKEPAYYFNIITEYATKEMTLDEIEKELGYKVKIINKKKGKTN